MGCQGKNRVGAMGGGRGQGCGGGLHNGNGCGKHQGEGRGVCGHGMRAGNCTGDGKKGKKRELFQQKYSEYVKSINLPEFSSDADYQKWTEESTEGKEHVENIKRIWAQIDSEMPWGGKRNNSGRPKECLRKISYTRRISIGLLDKLKDYAKENGISETEALEKAIERL